MSEKIKPCLTVDGKDYVLCFNREMQATYQKMLDEKKKDKEYQRLLVESQRLKAEYEDLFKRYTTARNAYLDEPMNAEKKEFYMAIKAVYEEAYNAYSEFSRENDVEDDINQYTLSLIEKLVIIGLKTQYNISENEATAIWDKYCEEHGIMGSMEFLAYCGELWLTGAEEDTDENFIKAMRARNRKK